MDNVSASFEPCTVERFKKVFITSGSSTKGKKIDLVER